MSASVREIPPAPDHLAEAGMTLWSAILEKYDLRPDELRTLEDACAASDMVAEFTRAWVDAGRPYMSTGSMGQEVEHPLIGSIDKQRKARQAFFRQLRLPEERSAPADASGAAREAASSRWSRGA